jgi:hypothetical protein
MESFPSTASLNELTAALHSCMPDNLFRIIDVPVPANPVGAHASTTAAFDVAAFNFQVVNAMGGLDQEAYPSLMAHQNARAPFILVAMGAYERYISLATAVQGRHTWAALVMHECGVDPKERQEELERSMQQGAQVYQAVKRLRSGAGGSLATVEEEAAGGTAAVEVAATPRPNIAAAAAMAGSAAAAAARAMEISTGAGAAAAEPPSLKKQRGPV